VVLLAGKNLFTPYRVERLADIYSPVLRRPIMVDVFIPPSYYASRKRYPLLILNDGQDAEAIRLRSSLTRLTKLGQMREIIVAAVYAGDRMQEYGVASQPDYKKRGSKAASYSTFIVRELLPLLKNLFRLDLNRTTNAIAGFSLGGLSAFDIGWNNPELFQKVGVFSGSLWWRSKAYNDGYSDHIHRIMHVQVHETEFKPG
jgi:predicted alpha/beta superfamily hydrolase